jgi:hypothetical protein
MYFANDLCELQVLRSVEYENVYAWIENAVAQLVEALGYKPEDRGFVSFFTPTHTLSHTTMYWSFKLY